jgi:hypothetical protein
MERILQEQRSAAELLLAGHPDERGLRLCVADWVMEEVMEKQVYESFLGGKRFSMPDSGFQVGDLNPKLFDWQAVITRWALRKGRASLFAGCGMGKTAMQLEWANQVVRKLDRPVLVLAPLAVADQTCSEGDKFEIPVTLCRHRDDVRAGINITNYEMLHEFDPSVFGGVVLDESSILKDHTSKTRQAITESFSGTPYRLCCSATPAPNDWMELATHAEFMGAMKRAEMLSMFFVHDGGDTSKWRLKGHAADEFWKWVCSWAVMIQKPSDIGFSDDGFDLPPIERIQLTVESRWDSGQLFPVEAKTFSLQDRVRLAAERVNSTKEPFLVWCDLNAESEALSAAIPDAVEVTGSDSNSVKAKAMADFSAGRVRALVSKPSICGYGMNWQHCADMAFVGLSDSFEQVYQAERRCWRFGQKRKVTSYVITSEAEGAVVRNQERKLADFERMSARMVAHMRTEMQRELGVSHRARQSYDPQMEMTIPEWLKEIA